MSEWKQPKFNSADGVPARIHSSIKGNYVSPSDVYSRDLVRVPVPKKEVQSM